MKHYTFKLNGIFSKNVFLSIIHSWCAHHSNMHQSLHKLRCIILSFLCQINQII